MRRGYKPAHKQSVCAGRSDVAAADDGYAVDCSIGLIIHNSPDYIPASPGPTADGLRARAEKI